ncbi:LPXTG-motif cell wall anchor domain protein [[Clostridium] hylemonae DSM 15053]|uniref:LPXTG-motif cell wall anchor domain protein n=1 Tax=[Clostridium] hylemonae DSM 15053 TaxID=553973 RepID=C0C4C1_9FIRM|nr:leucine-rich repeat protein [[Clostridium] hylemonae]EEG72914.1 LPXTG-motif cell wall anchor domain protein [[Clostridium] hylemonae DSM 15053]
MGEAADQNSLIRSDEGGIHMKKAKKSILALLLAVMMLFSLAPAPVFATGADDAPTGSSTQTKASEGAPSDVGSGAPDIITSEQQTDGAQTGAQFDQSGTVDLNRYDSFEEAASAQTNEPRTQYTTLKITGKTNRDTWTTDDRNYFRTNFSRVAELDLGNFTGTFGERAFEKSSIEKVRLPADVSIPIYMFSGCKSLATLSVGSNLPASGVIDLTGFTAAYSDRAFEDCTSIKEVKLPADVAIANAMFSGCKSLATLSVAGNINAQGGVIDLTGFTATYGGGAFRACDSIKEVKLPADVAIGDYMFYGCGSLATLSVEGNINAQGGVIDLTGFTAAYGDDAFRDCISITEARLPDAAISQEVFIGCTNLDVLMFYGAGAPGVGFKAFSGVHDGGTLYYPQGGMDYTKGTFGAPDLANWDFIEAFGPEVVTQPSAQTGTVGQTAAFQFAVSGAPLAFRWQQSVNNGSWTDLADGGGYAGTATDMLIIDNLQQEQNGYKFRCVASNYGNYSADVISKAVTLTVSAEPALQPPAAPYDKAAPGDLVFTYTGAIAGPDVGVSAQFTYLPTGEVSTNLPPESRTGAGDGFVYTPDVGVTFPLALMQQHASPNGSGVAGLRTGRYRLDLTVMLADGVSKVYSAEFEIIDSTPVPVPKPGSTIPQTGDTANPLSWLLIILAALAVCASLLLYRKRRAKDSKATGIPRKR